jgi:multiple sugar transport system substrate-binding protein
MLVNENIFKKEGLEIPASYSQLIEACTKLKASGYKSPIMAYMDNFIGLPMVFAYFCKSVMKNPESVMQLNELNNNAGEYLRPTLEWIENFMKLKLIDINECRTIKDKYNAVIMRFFEGNVPIMLCDTDTVSGTLKRETQSDSFINNPFKYSFHTFPSSDEESDFVNSVAVGFSVNKNSKNLEMADEFIRFLIKTKELNNLAKIKRLITSSVDYSVDEIYSSLSQANPIYLHELGLMDNANRQMRFAVEHIMLNNMTVDEAIKNYGKF